GARGWDRGVRTEPALGGLGRELAAVIGGARLHHDRLALWRARHCERSTDLEERAAMVEHVALVRIVEAPVRLVEHECVVVPAVPQAAHHVDELPRAAV